MEMQDIDTQHAGKLGLLLLHMFLAATGWYRNAPSAALCIFGWLKMACRVRPTGLWQGL